MTKMVEQANRIDFVSDTYQHPSIKDVEREKRRACACEAVIQGPEQRRLKKCIFQRVVQTELFSVSCKRVEQSRICWSSSKQNHILRSGRFMLQIFLQWCWNEPRDVPPIVLQTRKSRYNDCLAHSWHPIIRPWLPIDNKIMQHWCACDPLLPYKPKQHFDSCHYEHWNEWPK